MLTLNPVEVSTLAPLAPQVAELPVLNRPLREVLAERIGNVPGVVMWDIDFWPSDAQIAMLRDLRESWHLVTAEGRPVASCNYPGSMPARTIPADGLVIRYPWDLLAINEQLIGQLRSSKIEGVVKAGAVLEGNVWLGAGSVILPGVYIEGNAIIGCNTKVGPNCYIRGNTAIGNNCHIGQAVEVKNSVLAREVSAGHLSYIGDSVVAERVNFGAGTIISNFRHDGTNHRSMVDGVLVNTGRRKFGAIIGAGVHTGIHSAIYPGRKLWPGVSTLPGEVIQTDKHS